MIYFEVKNRWTGAVQFVAEINCAEDAPRALKLRLAVMWALKLKISLTCCDLNDADLSTMDLAWADFAGASCARANFAYADLCATDFTGVDCTAADFTNVNATVSDFSLAKLTHAICTNANFRGSCMPGADFCGADLNGANLNRTDLTHASFVRADLTGTNFAETKWRDGVIINRRPLQLAGLEFPVIIFDDHMEIGCELHSIGDWAAFDDRHIIRMGGARAIRFWHSHKYALLALAASDARGPAAATQEIAA
ncbi:pentapeptide repeat-containing protein [Govanella unica]|uniref:Pentapeptide repeat-containing protein n=1 Tax=Govanella unica TaxID=2975056 RepID=A0A9X3Z639_9PROT|nr:pentapeptide repeat-containing protein [Govania unica]MDA5192780.1 pentapeptide repeat-containing protein [Govania unica]